MLMWVFILLWYNYSSRSTYNPTFIDYLLSYIIVAFDLVEDFRRLVTQVFFGKNSGLLD